MKIMKKSGLTICSFVLMLMVAGYINYKYDPNREQNLGQTVYVNGKDSYTYENVSIYEDEKNNQDEQGNEITEKVNTQGYKDDSVAIFKYDRDNMFSELEENYNSIICNASTDANQLKEYQTKLNDLVSKKNLIIMVENVIKSYGIDEAVIIPTNNDNINVVINEENELDSAMIAKIQQILVDQLGCSASRITIKNLKENNI